MNEKNCGVFTSLEPKNISERAKTARKRETV
jgi:hypothetical protein